MIHKALISTRFVILIGVLGSFLAALAALFYGAGKAVLVIISIFNDGISENGGKAVAVSFIEVVDLFLIGTVFYIVALGLYELFIDDALDLPGWLVIRNLDDLKRKLINGIVVILAVSFLGSLVDWNGQTNLLPLSLSIALIIAALTFFLYATGKSGEH